MLGSDYLADTEHKYKMLNVICDGHIFLDSINNFTHDWTQHHLHFPILQDR